MLLLDTGYNAKMSNFDDFVGRGKRRTGRKPPTYSRDLQLFPLAETEAGGVDQVTKQPLRPHCRMLDIYNGATLQENSVLN